MVARVTQKDGKYSVVIKCSGRWGRDGEWLRCAMREGKPRATPPLARRAGQGLSKRRSV